MVYFDRIKSHQQFQQVYKFGKRYIDLYFVAFILDNQSETLRFGITVSRKIGNAVMRNRAKRIIREAFRCIAPNLHTGYDIVIIARKKITTVKSTELEPRMNHIFSEAKLMNQ